MITVLFVAGIVFLGIEFSIPGFGVFGLLGMMSLLGALYYALGGGLFAAIVVTVAAFVILAITILVIKQLPNSRIGQKLTLTLESTKERGYSGNDERVDLIGKEGVVVTVLRPSGKVNIDDNPVDVVTDGEFLEPGTKVVVVDATGGRVLVRKVS